MKADLLVYEGFDYTLGNTLNGTTGDGVAENGGQGWNAAWGGGDNITVVNGLSSDKIPSFAGGAASSADDTNNRVMNASFDTSVGSELWFSVLVSAASYNNNQRLLMFTNGSSSNGFGVQFGSGTVAARLANSNSTTTAAISSNDTHLIVGRFTWGSADGTTTAHSLSIWLDPDSSSTVLDLGAADSTISKTAAIATTNAGSGNIRVGTAASSAVYLRSALATPITYDELRMGTSLSDVMVPEPQTYALMAGLLALGLAVRRRRRA